MIKRFKTVAKNWLMAFIHPRPLIGVFFLPRFFKHWILYAKSAGAEKISVLDLQPCLGDWSAHTPFDAHYFFQGAWLARKLATSKISKHIDIGSSVLTMGVLSGHVETIFVDYRPLKASLPGLTSIAGDILKLPFPNDALDSISCLHVIEHIGLGRYGDPIDPLGSVKAAIELQRIVACGGSLYISMPIGRERICFNGHRVHAPTSVLKLFPQMKLTEFSYVDDAGRYHQDKLIESATGLEYGCGMFHFTK